MTACDQKIEAGRLPIPPSLLFCINLNTACVAAGVMTTSNHSQDQHGGVSPAITVYISDSRVNRLFKQSLIFFNVFLCRQSALLQAAILHSINISHPRL